MIQSAKPDSAAQWIARLSWTMTPVDGAAARLNYPAS